MYLPSLLYLSLFSLSLSLSLHFHYPHPYSLIHTLPLPLIPGASSAANKQVSAVGAAQLSIFLQRPSVPLSSTVPQLCSIAMHDKERVRCTAFRVLADMLTVGLLSSTDALIKKNVFPAVCSVLLGE